MAKYLESMKIAHAKRLADELHIPLLLLLDASLSLSNKVNQRDPEGFREVAEVGDPDIPLAV